MHGSLQRLIVPVDGSAGDRRVLELVCEWMHQQAVAITLLYVVEVVQSMPLDAELPTEIATGDIVLNDAERLARTTLGSHCERVTTELLQARSAGAAIVDEAVERHADAIVMAATNRLKQGKTTMGDNVAYVLKNAPCDVIVVRLAPAAHNGRQERAL
jgi:nucleotide-binding universal stress UspA family protein